MNTPKNRQKLSNRPKMLGNPVPKLPSVESTAPPCTNPSCGRVLELEKKEHRCPKCTSAYCSHGCRKSDERHHSPFCKQLAKGVDLPENSKLEEVSQEAQGCKWSPPQGLDERVSVPFTKLYGKVWLHGRPPNDVYRILIDAYRLRMDDDRRVDRKVDPDSVYGGHATGIPSLRRFIDLTRARDGLMPSWWNDFRRTDCEAMALGTEEPKWHRLCAMLDEELVFEHYKDPTFATQLRIFAEAVYGTAVGGMSLHRTMEEMVYSERLLDRFNTFD